ncbi:MAG: restriction endonuclease subunit S [Terriglobia bacterium]
MSSPWQHVSLGDVLTHRKEFITINDLTEYRRPRVQLHAQGIVLRDVVQGALIKTKSQQVCRAGEFLVAEIDAKVGGFGMVPAELDAAIVSSHYFLFVVDESRLDRQFLDYFIRTLAFRDQVSAQGSTNYAAIRPAHVLGYHIPLPPLDEQKRIVARIENLAARLDEARKLRRGANEDAQALVASTAARLFEPKADWRNLAIADFCEPTQYGYTESATDEPVGPRFLRITDIQNGDVDWQRVPYCRCPNPEKYLLKSNDLLFARTGASTGKSFLIRDCPEAVFASYLIRLRVRDTVTADYLYRYFQSPSYWAQIADEKKGTGQPNLNGSKLEKLTVPVPPFPEQERIVAELDALQRELNVLQRIQAETAAELGALLPSILDRAFKGELSC